MVLFAPNLASIRKHQKAQLVPISKSYLWVAGVGRAASKCMGGELSTG